MMKTIDEELKNIIYLIQNCKEIIKIIYWR